MRIYTKTGDDGKTGLLGGHRVEKDDIRIEAYGTVDELSAVLGVVRAMSVLAEIDQFLAEIQNKLFTVGAQLATPAEQESSPKIEQSDIERLEQAIDRFNEPLPPLTEFVLPGGTTVAAELHQARTVCRRAERRVVTLGRKEEVSELVLIYLNRLGDLLFVLARNTNFQAGLPDVTWQK